MLVNGKECVLIDKEYVLNELDTATSLLTQKDTAVSYVLNHIKDYILKNGN